MVIKAVKAIQDLAYCVGQKGCYAISLYAVAEKITGVEVDVLKTTKFLIDQGVIDYDWARPKAYNNSMYVKNADEVLRLLGCDGWYVSKVSELPENYDGYYIIRYTLNGNTHFRLPDYDSMTDNPLVKNGRISAYYLIKKKA